MNGRLEFRRTVFWNEQHGAVVPMDILLGIEASNYSLGVREICCRESLNNAFVPASENVKRLAQLDISSSVVRQIVEHEGSVISKAQHRGQADPDFKAEECTDKTMITGTDGVMVPLVTEQQKLKRRRTQASYVLFGEGSKEALDWKEKMMGVVKNQGSLVMLDRLGQCLEELPDDAKRKELENLREYIGKRIAMTEMALASIYYSNQWGKYWESRHKAA